MPLRGPAAAALTLTITNRNLRGRFQNDPANWLGMNQLRCLGAIADYTLVEVYRNYFRILLPVLGKAGSEKIALELQFERVCLNAECPGGSGSLGTSRRWSNPVKETRRSRRLSHYSCFLFVALGRPC